MGGVGERELAVWSGTNHPAAFGWSVLGVKNYQCRRAVRGLSFSIAPLAIDVESPRVCAVEIRVAKKYERCNGRLAEQSKFSLQSGTAFSASR